METISRRNKTNDRTMTGGNTPEKGIMMTNDHTKTARTAQKHTDAHLSVKKHGDTQEKCHKSKLKNKKEARRVIR